MNWRMKSATRRPRPGDPALAHQEAALALARQQRLAVVELEDEVEPAGAATSPGRAAGSRCGSSTPGPRCARRPPARTPAPHSATSSGIPSGSATAGVDRAAEGDHRVDPLAAPVGGGLVAEHPALRVAAEVDVAAGRLADAVDGVADARRRGRRACARGRPPRARGRRSRPPTGRRRARAGRETALERRRDVVDVGGEHQRRDEQHRRAGGRILGVVVAQPVDRPLGGDLVRRRLLAGLEAAEARDLERVLGGGAEARRGLRDRSGISGRCAGRYRAAFASGE